VEGATHRKVIAYMSSIHVDPDLAVELFVLAPQAEEATETLMGVDDMSTEGGA
jgi:hypothetical protein